MFKIYFMKTTHRKPDTEEVSRPLDDGQEEEVEEGAAGHVVHVEHQLQVNKNWVC